MTTTEVHAHFTGSNLPFLSRPLATHTNWYEELERGSNHCEDRRVRASCCRDGETKGGRRDAETQSRKENNSKRNPTTFSCFVFLSASASSLLCDSAFCD